MAHAERVDKALQRDLPTALDRAEQIAHRGRAVTLDVLEFEFCVALFQRENVGRLLHETFVEEVLELLLAKAVDVEGAPRHEQFQMLDLLVGAGELAGAASA